MNGWGPRRCRSMPARTPRSTMCRMSEASPSVTRVKRLRFSIEPDPAQCAELEALFGLRRAAYNAALQMRFSAASARQAARVKNVIAETVPRLLTSTEVSRLWTQLRNGEGRLARDDGPDHDFQWAKSLPAQPAQQALSDAGVAWHRWQTSQSRASTTKGRKVAAPKFRSKKDRKQTVRFVQTGAKFTAPRGDASGTRPPPARLRLSGVSGTLRVTDSPRVRHLLRQVEARTTRVTSVTITRVGPDWTACVAVEVASPVRAPRTPAAPVTVGVDVGSRVRAVASTGRVDENERRYDAHRDFIAHLQRRMDRLTPGSRRHKELTRRLSRLHAKIARQRAHDIHTATRALVENQDQPSVFVIEDLAVQNLTASGKGTRANPNHRRHVRRARNRAMRDASPARFLTALTYKAVWAGHQVVVAPRTYPSSKTCSACGVRNSNLGSARTFTCERAAGGCGLSIDRDLNAAMNLESYGRAVLASATAAAGGTSSR